jgi:hypothetical protein
MTTKQELDRLFQELSKGKRCEFCLRPAECIHHIIEKSRSEYLRWDYHNACPVCLHCHNEIHLGHIKPLVSDYLRMYENVSLKDKLITLGITQKEYMEQRKQELRSILNV